ncbi:MAG: hypothetical protein KF678_12070 [Phycisphaeraceae bacterium]|nr:hypothetical protein [Phycisphaeraceae bacterium]
MGHEYQDRVSLEMARRVALGLPSNPEWITLARENLARWKQVNHDAPGLLRAYSEWESILDRPVAEICGVLLQETDEGQRLRQNSPFAGVLSAAEVWDIKRRVRHEQNAA